jgi:hypothetical protein
MSTSLPEEGEANTKEELDAQVHAPDFPSKVCCDDLFFIAVILTFLFAVGIRFITAEKQCSLIRNA